MDFKTSFHISIEEAFQKYHEENPLVYEHFKTFALEWIASKSKKISSKQIIGRIRWFVAVETKDDNFKINDAYTAHYGRLFVKDYPQYIDNFFFRNLRAA